MNLQHHAHHDTAAATGRRVVTDIDVDTARARFSSGALLLDVREDSEWAAGHVEGAGHVPLGDLDPTVYPSDREILVLCRSGMRSSRGTAALANAGRNAVNVAGGMKAWAGGGHAVVTDSGDPGRVS